jgi:hypothetical protein
VYTSGALVGCTRTGHKAGVRPDFRRASPLLEAVSEKRGQARLTG